MEPPSFLRRKEEEEGEEEEISPPPFNYFWIRHCLPSVREMALGKLCFAVSSNVVCCLPSAALGKVVAECILGFVECLRHSAKLHSLVVAVSLVQIYRDNEDL